MLHQSNNLRRQTARLEGRVCDESTPLKRKNDAECEQDMPSLRKSKGECLYDDSILSTQIDVVGYYDLAFTQDIERLEREYGIKYIQTDNE